VVGAAGRDLVLDVGAPVDLGHDRPPAPAHGGQAERGGDRRLADAALARDVDQAAVQEPGYASPSS
jgi:hypothetical protein